MALINTVTGPIDSTELGFCQPHEHVCVTATPASAVYPALCIDDERLSAAELSDYRDCGGCSIVDCQPTGAGRDLFALRRISVGSAVRIISVTGYHMPMFYPSGHWIFTEGVRELRDRFLSELTLGVSGDGTGGRIFPGAVKAAIGKDGPADRFEVCLRAAAAAAAEAEVPLILHTEAGVGAVQAIAVCEQEGLDPARIAVCHVDRQAEDYAPHEAVARTGVYLEYDTIARYKYHDDPSEVALIRHMLALGYGDHLLLSLDTTSARMRRYQGAPGMGYILREFLPMLAQAGISRLEIDTITQANPRRLFE